MKKIYAILSAALLIAAAASCAKENIVENVPADGTTFTATLDEGAKFAIDGEGKSTWTPGDVITVYNGNYTADFALFRDAQGGWDTNYVEDIVITEGMISSDGRSVTFEVNLPAPIAGKWYLCAYGCPYMVPAYLYHGPVYAVFPQQIEGGAIPFLAATATTSTAATFHNVSTLVRMKCSNADIKYVTFESNDGSSFINEGDIVLNDNGTINSIYDPQRKAPKITSHIEGLGTDKYFYIGMYEQTLPEGFTIKAYEADPASSTPVMTVKRNVNLALAAGHVLDLGDFVTSSKKGKYGWTITGAGDVENLIDNEINTFWKTSDYPASVVIDFQKAMEFNEVIFNQVYGNATVGNTGYVNVEVSNDNENWTPAVPESFGLYNYGWRQHITLSQTENARYLRITVFNSYDSNPASLAEIDIALKGTDHDYESSPTGYEYPILVNGGSEVSWGYFYSDGSSRFEPYSDPPDWVNRMQRVTGWIHNDAMNISCDKNSGNRMCYWAAPSWGCPHVANGKVYQKLNLLPGTYTFEIGGCYTQTGGAEVYGVVAKGKSIPDFENVETGSLRYVAIDKQQDMGQAMYLQFTLDEPSEVCVGVVGKTTDSGQPYTDFYFNYFRFYVN